MADYYFCLYNIFVVDVVVGSVEKLKSTIYQRNIIIFYKYFMLKELLINC